MKKISPENIHTLSQFLKTPAWAELKQAVVDHKEKRVANLLSMDLSDANKLALEASKLKGFAECLQYIHTVISLEEKKNNE
jgi:hypothetical protein